MTPVVAPAPPLVTRSPTTRLLWESATITRWPYCQERRIQSIHIFWCVMSSQRGQYVNAGNPSAPAGAVCAPLSPSMALMSAFRPKSPQADWSWSPRVGPSCDSASAMLVARWS